MAVSLTRLSTTELSAELRRRQKAAAKLVRKHTQHLAKADAIRAQIEELGGRVDGTVKGGERPRNKQTLVDALVTALTGKTMSVTYVAQAIQDAGYRTTSRTFRTQVNIALINSGKFTRVDRGQYTAK
jgi:hypothetical protein